MFLQVSVILFTGGACSWGVLLLEGVWSQGIGACFWEGLVPGGSGPRGSDPWGVLVQGVPGGDPQMATAVGSMHPTGMHSCVKCNFM